MYRQKMHVVVSNPIDDAIAANDDLFDVLNSQLRNDSPQTGVTHQTIGSAENPVSERRRYLRSVPSNE